MKLKTLSMTAAVAAMIAGGAFAQDTTATDTMPANDGVVVADDTTAVAPMYTDIKEMTVGDALSMIAYDPTGERVGDIDYVIQGLDGAEFVVGIGGFLGLGEYTVALPIEEFDLNSDGTGFVIDTTKERLEQLPEFDESNAESLPDDVVIGTLIHDEPMTEEPAAEEPAAEDSMSEETMSEEPATEEPMTEEPMTEEPATEEEPATDETVTQ